MNENRREYKNKDDEIGIVVHACGFFQTEARKW